MGELRAWSSVTTGRQRMIGSRRNISGRNISLKGLTSRERVSIILLQQVLPTMQSAIICFCSTCGPAPLCYTTHVCFDRGRQPQNDCQHCIPFFFSYSSKALKMSLPKYEVYPKQIDVLSNPATKIHFVLRVNQRLFKKLRIKGNCEFWCSFGFPIFGWPGHCFIQPLM